MTDAATPIDLCLRILFLCAYAFLFAAVEIEIEGPHGWAERLPTWFRVTTPSARFYAVFMRGKPLTGYHAVMFVLPLWSFHLGFVGGVPWTWAAEATTLAAYLAWAVTWDLMWFILNPRYGWAGFRKGAVWWHDRSWLGRFPIDYYGALVLSLGFAASAYLTTSSFAVLGRHAILVGSFALALVASHLMAPRYMRWYQRMRRPDADERALVLPPAAPGPEPAPATPNAP